MAKPIQYCKVKKKNNKKIKEKKKPTKFCKAIILQLKNFLNYFQTWCVSYSQEDVKQAKNMN